MDVIGHKVDPGWFTGKLAHFNVSRLIQVLGFYKCKLTGTQWILSIRKTTKTAIRFRILFIHNWIFNGITD